jgi:hypothetical protein
LALSEQGQQRFPMLLGQLTSRLTAEQFALVINCQPDDVPIHVTARLLKPLAIHHRTA